MIQQFRYFIQDYVRLSGKNKLRLILTWTNRAAVGVWVYRFERSMFLTFGKSWNIIRILFLPILLFCYAYSNCDINYRADIGPGIKILHPAGGIVISGKCIIGKNLSLTGGNFIGSRPDAKIGNFLIGDNLYMSANSVILGPIILGNHVNVGAGAVVVKNAEDNSILIGVPAKPMIKENIRE